MAFGTNIGSNSADLSGKSIETAALAAEMQISPGNSPMVGKSVPDGCKGNQCDDKTDAVKLTEEEWISRYNLNIDAIQMVVQFGEVSEVRDDDPNSSIFVGNQQIALDSGATSVVGAKCLHEFKGSNPTSSILFSKKRFKFGDPRVFGSLEITRIHIIVEVTAATGKKLGRHFTIVCDVVPCTAPLLLSRAAMENLKCCLDFEHKRLLFRDDSFTQLKLASDGHLALTMQKDCVSSSHHLNVVLSSENVQVEEPNSNQITKDDIRKLHLHLDHGSSSSTLLRILQLSKKSFGKLSIDSVLRECPRRDSLHKLQAPTVSSYVPPFPSHTICLDIFYLPEATISTVPHLLIVCALTRFIVVCRLRNMIPETVIDAVVENWIMYFGRMVQIAMDRGPGLIGRCWGDFADSWACQVSLTPKGSSHSNGIDERQIDLVKMVLPGHAKWEETPNMSLFYGKWYLPKISPLIQVLGFAQWPE